MADLEHQLRDCLSRHADTATAAPGLSTAAKARSHRLTRRAHVTAALAIVPVTAGTAVGVVSLANAASHGGPQRLQTRVTSAASPSTTPTTTSGPSTIAWTECPKNLVPRLKAKDGSLKGITNRPVSMSAIIRRNVHIHGSNTQGLKSIDYLRVVGHKPSGKVLAIEVVPRNGKVKWTLVVEHSPNSFSSHPATFLGCAPKAAANNRH